MTSDESICPGGLFSSGLTGFLDILYVACFNYFRWCGIVCRKALRIFARLGRHFYRRYLSRQMHRVDLAWLKVRKFFSRIRQSVLFQIYLFFRFFIDAWRVVREGFCRYPDRNILIRTGAMLCAFFRGVRNNAHLFVTLFNYALPIAAAVAFCNLVGYVSSLNFVVNVEYNGQHIGFIQNETVYEQAVAALQQRILYQQGDETLNQTPRFEVTIADWKEVSDAAALTNAMMQFSNDDIVAAMGIWVDGEFFGAVRDGSGIEDMLLSRLDAFRQNEQETPSFTKSITLERGFYLSSNIRPESAVLEELTRFEEEDVYDTVQSGDAPLLIAERNDMTLDELVALNPDILEVCRVGDTVKVHSSRPFLPVQVTREVTYTVEIPYSTSTYSSSSLWEGTQQVTTAGVNGEKQVTADISYVDGVEVSRVILEETVTREPVTCQVAVGTKVMPKTADISGAPVSKYGMIWPTQQWNRYISSYFGNSSGRTGHYGLDIAFRGNGYGTPVLAVLPGVVTYAGWNGSYGNLVIIDHQNGLVTYYAHNSKLNVQVGQTVVQGQIIAAVGSTGRSTGNHIHFEVHENGVRRNPLNYLP